MNKDDRRSGIGGRSGGLCAFFPALNKEDDERGGKHGCGCKEDPTLCVNAFELFKQHKTEKAEIAELELIRQNMEKYLNIASPEVPKELPLTTPEI